MCRLKSWKNEPPLFLIINRHFHYKFINKWLFYEEVSENIFRLDKTIFLGLLSNSYKTVSSCIWNHFISASADGTFPLPCFEVDLFLNSKAVCACFFNTKWADLEFCL